MALPPLLLLIPLSATRSQNQIPAAVAPPPLLVLLSFLSGTRSKEQHAIVLALPPLLLRAGRDGQLTRSYDQLAAALASF
jgi:hypothetical protein